mgnify:CR=1 FL=1
MMLRYKKVSNTNQYNSKATRLAAYNAHKDDESEMEDLDPWKLLDKIGTESTAKSTPLNVHYSMMVLYKPLF